MLPRFKLAGFALLMRTWKIKTLMESFFSTLKQEELYRSSYRSENEFKKRVSEYMKFYNKRRPHRANQYKTPDEAENAFYEKNAG